jgi:predicted RNA binding protein YcfA (HicA-like mRNA interferase family)
LTTRIIRVILDARKEGRRLRVSELVKYLEKNGCKLIKHGSRHDLYMGVNGKPLPISRDRNKDYGKRMVAIIKKQAGLE